MSPSTERLFQSVFVHPSNPDAGYHFVLQWGMDLGKAERTPLLLKRECFAAHIAGIHTTSSKSDKFSSNAPITGYMYQLA